ncbi:protein RFT1 [Trifolium pratense]|uniref:Protein RFT1 homolog n=1 Tax=Trifolium pratense TaxID=57577 RepID=A0A2K3PKU6_TRIPR|nr:protein RFT1 [Trifolium pratense]
MSLRILYSAMFIKDYFKGSSSFSFRGCLPSGWVILLLSSVITLISENVFLDQDNFWPTFMIHFSVGLACFSTVGKNLSSRKLFAFVITRTDDFHKLAMR